MKIKLHTTVSLHEIGRRDNNEDCIFPTKDESAEYKRNLFLVCDGVGGAAKGEVASSIVCEVLSDYLAGRDVIIADDINRGITLAEDKISKFIANDIEANGMATTMTLAAFHEEGVTIAHLGDSRVYQIRDGNILFKTSDHSFVNELVMKNIISEEEALTHPRKNVVTKAIGGRHEEADVTYIKDVLEEDYFFLCTDGILESVSDDKLKELLADESLSNQEKIDEIKSLCSLKSRDNFSAHLIQVDSVVTAGATEKIDEIIWKNPKMINYLFGAIILFIIGVIGILAMKGGPAEDKELPDDSQGSIEIPLTPEEEEEDFDSNEISIMHEDSSFYNVDTIHVPGLENVLDSIMEPNNKSQNKE